MKLFFALIRFLFLSSIKIFAMIFYRTDLGVIGEGKSLEWANTKLILVLNHTSLFEPLYASIIPFSYLWHMSRHLVYPIADVTSNRPITGILFDLMAPKAVAVSRKRDETWTEFINEVRGESVVILLPEGRMKRADGYDKHGEVMSVRGGFYDVMKCMNSGDLLLVYSGGLHHIHRPGQRFPTLFKKMILNVEQLDLVSYFQSFSGQNAKLEMIKDLERRRDAYCPRADKTPWRTSKIDCTQTGQSKES